MKLQEPERAKLKSLERMKRATIIVEYLDEKTLTQALEHVKNELLSGTAKDTKTWSNKQVSYVATFSQVYCDNFKRVKRLEEREGVMHEIVRSNV